MPNKKLIVDRRAQQISRKLAGEDELVDAVLTDKIDPALLEMVLDIKADKLQKIYVESSLLTSATFEEISEYFEIPIEVLQLYADIHYNVRNLTRLQKLSVLSKEKDGDTRQLKTWAISQGFDFIKWRTGSKIRIAPVDGLVTLFGDCYFKSKEAFFNGNATEASKEAGKWVKQSTDIARLLKVWTTDSDEARQDIELALEKIAGDDIAFVSSDDLDIDLNEDYKEE